MTKEEKDKLEAAVRAARRIPMTIEEEYRNADVPMPNDMLNASNTEQFKNEPVEKDDRGDLDLTKIIDIQNKELKDLVHDNTILLEEVKRLVKKINELTKPKIEN